jgi:hypothetical protein
MTTSRRKLNPLLLAPVVIGGCFGLGLLFGQYGKDHWVPPTKWLGLGVFTAALFGLVFWEFRRNWNRVRLWGVMLLLLAMHLTAFTIILRNVEEWRAIWFGMGTVLESLLWFSVLWHMGLRPTPSKRRR